MSTFSDIGVVLSKMTERNARELIAHALELLVERYDFGFRSYGGIAALEFEDKGFVQERAIVSDIVSARAIDSDELDRLSRRERWFIIGGSIRIPDVQSLIDVGIVLYPTFDPEYPACVVFRVDGELYASVRGEDGTGFDEDAANRLLKLCISLGADDLVDGFQAVLIPELGEVCPFDGAALRHSLVKPRTVLDWGSSRGGLQPGFVTGIKKSILGEEDLTKSWSGYKVSKTTNEFVILNGLVDIRAR